MHSSFLPRRRVVLFVKARWAITNDEMNDWIIGTNYFKNTSNDPVVFSPSSAIYRVLDRDQRIVDEFVSQPLTDAVLFHPGDEHQFSFSFPTSKKSESSIWVSLAGEVAIEKIEEELEPA